MYKYNVLVRVNGYQTINTFVWADHDSAARWIAEAQYGVGNVLAYTRVSEEA